ncbi:MAG: LacI family DNA-binding transcriptional regulator [Rhodospirillaceae bacterium]|nr:LacI family DNA-binding transcriptional regulator [Rhodospirillaceae bacterium]
MRDVAARVGVHPSTVSRAFNPDKRALVSEDVVRQITETAQQLGYALNSAASGLRTNRTTTIGVVVSDLTNPTMSGYIRGIEDELLKAGYVSILFSSDWHTERKRRIIEIMRRRQLGGLILITTERDDEIVSACQDDNIPVVFLDRGSGHLNLPSVRLNDRLGTQLVIDHLTGLGHRKIAVISGPQHYSGAFGHHQHTIRSLAESNISTNPAQIVFAENYSVEEGDRCCEALMRNKADFTAIFALNEMLALGCYSTLRRHGLKCPDDVSVVGYNHRTFTDMVDPPLTTVRFPRQNTGRALARLLLERVQNRRVTLTKQFIQPTLTVRGSTAVPKP